MPELQDLIVVAGHAAFKADVDSLSRDVESEEAWALRPYQVGEVPLLVEHIRQGVILAIHNAKALCVFSGGHTSTASGVWSEGRTYQSVAAARSWWCADANVRQDIVGRTVIEDFARDSFENLLYSICRFHQVVRTYPRHVSVVSWGFKRERFEYHRAVLRLPAARFRFVGPNDPPDLAAASRAEAETLTAFSRDPYGSRGPLALKRASRDSLRRQHTYDQCPGMAEFFHFLQHGATEGQPFLGELPWEIP